MRYPNLDLDELIGNSLVFGRNLGKSWKKSPLYPSSPSKFGRFFNCNSLKVEPWVGGPKFGLETTTTKVKLEDSGYQTHQARRDARLKIEMPI